MKGNWFLAIVVVDMFLRQISPRAEVHRDTASYLSEMKGMSLVPWMHDVSNARPRSYTHVGCADVLCRAVLSLVVPGYALSLSHCHETNRVDAMNL